jgi:hypothetical protein
MLLDRNRILIEIIPDQGFKSDPLERRSRNQIGVIRAKAQRAPEKDEFELCVLGVLARSNESRN